MLIQHMVESSMVMYHMMELPTRFVSELFHLSEVIILPRDGTSNLGKSYIDKGTHGSIKYGLIRVLFLNREL